MLIYWFSNNAPRLPVNQSIVPLSFNRYILFSAISSRVKSCVSSSMFEGRRWILEGTLPAREVGEVGDEERGRTLRMLEVRLSSSVLVAEGMGLTFTDSA